MVEASQTKSKNVSIMSVCLDLTEFFDTNCSKLGAEGFKVVKLYYS